MQNQLKNALALLFLFSMNSIMAQDSLTVKIKTNPILFWELYGGFGGGEASGFVYGTELNYQLNRDLITFRLGGFTGLERGFLLLGHPEDPLNERNSKIVDYSLLYGKRWIGEGTSFSVSAGISITNWKHMKQQDDYYFYDSQSSLGLPFELNIKWFKRVKRRFRAYYWLIPITKEKVSFGRSFGFKLVGNISKTDYIGLAFNYSLGTHKKY